MMKCSNTEEDFALHIPAVWRHEPCDLQKTFNYFNTSPFERDCSQSKQNDIWTLRWLVAIGWRRKGLSGRKNAAHVMPRWKSPMYEESGCRSTDTIAHSVYLKKSAYPVKVYVCLFERPSEVSKNGIFPFKRSSFILDIFKLLLEKMMTS